MCANSPTKKSENLQTPVALLRALLVRNAHNEINTYMPDQLLYREIFIPCILKEKFCTSRLSQAGLRFRMTIPYPIRAFGS